MKNLLLALIILFTSPIIAESRQPLGVDDAFQFSLMAKDHQTLIAQWKIAPGYYLYRERIHINPANPEITRFGRAWLPNGISKTDPELGKYQVYANDLKIILPISETTEKLLTLTIDYQGCSEQGYCYPPTEKVVRINLEGDYLEAVQALNIDLPPKATKANQQNKITHLLATQHPIWILIAFLSFGLLISLTPCVLPMIPILSAIIMGQKHLSRRHAFLLSLSYVLAMAVTYASIGVVFALIGSNLQTLLQKPPVIIIFCLVFVAMACSLLGLYELQLPAALRARLYKVSEQQKRGTYLSAAVMGLLSTLVVSPCVTAPLVGVLSYISSTGNLLLGGTSLFMLGLGMGAPLLIIGATGHLIIKTGPWMERIKQLLGLIMLGVAIYLLARIIPATITMLLWSILALAAGIMLGSLNTATGFSSKINKGVGLGFCIYGLALMFSLIAGNTNPLHPWVSNKPVADTPNFIRVKSLEAVKQHIAAANGKPVLLDFYADWCVACKEMDRITFSNPEVQQLLKSWILLRADVTANDDQDKSLSQFYQVVAPPTLVFFNSKGKNLSQQTLIGEVSAAELAEHLKEIK